MNNNPIGVYDSGIGGLSVLNEVLKVLPNESYTYFADSLHCPYGQKNPDFIRERSFQVVEHLIESGAKAIVIACNSVTVTSIDELRTRFDRLPMFGIVPVVKTASEVTKNNRIGILSTTLTAKSAYQNRLIEEFCSECFVTNIGTDELVPFIEEGNTTSKELRSTLARALKPFSGDGIDTLALGCSHFIFLKDMINKLLPNVTLLDSGSAVARQVERVLNSEGLLSEGKGQRRIFETTGEISLLKKNIENLIGILEGDTIRAVEL